MPHGSSRADDEVWWWESSRVEVFEKFFLIETRDIMSLRCISTKSSYDLILTTISKSEDDSHLGIISRLFYTIDERRAYIRR